MSLPFEPDTVDAAKLRFADALTPDYDVQKCADNPALTPGKFRKHVFDFTDGIRMIASVDRLGSKRLLHLSFSLDMSMTPTPTIEWFMARVRELCEEFAGEKVIATHSTAVVAHFWFKAP